MRARKSIYSVVYHLALVAVVALLAFPFLWLVSTSFKLPHEIFSVVPRVIPDTPTLDNYYAVLQGRFPTYFRNSLVVSVGTSVLGVTVTSLAAYSLSRFRFRGRREFLVFILTTQMFPGVLFLAPLFVLLKAYGLLNSLAALIVAYSTFVIPFSTWMLKGYFDSIPVELEESAMTDGCSRLSALWRITIPLSAPGMATVTLFCFLLGWQEFLFAISFISSDEFRTLSVGVAIGVAAQFGAAWGQTMAFAVLMTVPVVIVFMFLQRYIVQGLTAGAVKG